MSVLQVFVLIVMLLTNSLAVVFAFRLPSRCAIVMRLLTQKVQGLDLQSAETVGVSIGCALFSSLVTLAFWLHSPERDLVRMGPSLGVQLLTLLHLAACHQKFHGQRKDLQNKALLQYLRALKRPRRTESRRL
ncbi:MAG: hypothetical protein K2W95_10215 [Candidatus Obscuribacterales bacterium]|nr:hypothetical protein [Candidatus Obscuribacterales bacterium]